MKSFEKLLLENKAWAADKLELDPEYFSNQMHTQSPEFFWIGCSDSRVPANEVTNTEPGDIFVHRNVANLVVNTDLNLLSVLQYAVEVLEVKHIIVCGHYNCGGVIAAMGNKQYGLIDNWLRHIKDVYRMYHAELDAIEDETLRARRFVEVNVMEQVLDLGKTSIVQNAWKNKQDLHVHGWVYDIHDGIIADLDVTCRGIEDLHSIYQFDI